MLLRNAMINIIIQINGLDDGADGDNPAMICDIVLPNKIVIAKMINDTTPPITSQIMVLLMRALADGLYGAFIK